MCVPDPSPSGQMGLPGGDVSVTSWRLIALRRPSWPARSTVPSRARPAGGTSARHGGASRTQHHAPTAPPATSTAKSTSAGWRVSKSTFPACRNSAERGRPEDAGEDPAAAAQRRDQRADGDEGEEVHERDGHAVVGAHDVVEPARRVPDVVGDLHRAGGEVVDRATARPRLHLPHLTLPGAVPQDAVAEREVVAGVPLPQPVCADLHHDRIPVVDGDGEVVASGRHVDPVPARCVEDVPHDDRRVAGGLAAGRRRGPRGPHRPDRSRGRRSRSRPRR